MQKVASCLTWFGSSILGFANLHQYVDTRELISNYLLICWSNGQEPLIKVIVHGGMGKLHVWPIFKFGQEQAQNSLPPCLLRHAPRVRWNACVAAMHQSAPHHCSTSPAAPFHVWDSVKGSPLSHSLASTSPPLPLRPVLPLCHSLPLAGTTIEHHAPAMAIHVELLAAAACWACAVLLSRPWLPQDCSTLVTIPPRHLRSGWQEPAPSPTSHGRCLSVWRRQGPRVRIWNNSGFQMRSQDLYE